MNPSDFTTIDLLRHGQCEGGEIFRGHTDVPLIEKGWQQMRDSLDYIGRPWPWQQIISSPLQRCADFADRLSLETNIPWQCEQSFKELDFGDWDGQAIDHIWKTCEEAAETFAKNPAQAPPPNGESLSQLQERVLQGWDSMVNRFQGGHLLSIQHGGTIRVILAHILEMPLNSVGRLHMPYAALCRIRVYPNNSKSPILVFHNPNDQ